MYDPRRDDPQTMGELIQLFKHKMGLSRKVLVAIPIAIVTLFALITVFSAAYTIDANAKGVVMRFGKFHALAMPGLNFKIPYVDSYVQVRTEKVFQEEFGFTTSRKPGDKASTVTTETYGTNSAALMLTGDRNVAVVPWIVQYQVLDPVAYLFNVEDPVALLRDKAEAVVRAVVGDRSMLEVIRERALIASESWPILQQELDDAGCGIKIVVIEMYKTDVPGPVQAAFNAVNEATQNKQTVIYNAEQAYNEVIPKARGEAKKIIQTAQGYAAEKVNNAKGDTAVFLALYEEYKLRPKITEQRLYYETMQYVLSKAENIRYVDGKLDSVLPLLNMNSTQNK